MVAKVMACIAGLGVIGCGVLAQRQARLQAASELAQAQVRLRTADDQFMHVRAEIAMAVAPSEVLRIASEVGPLRPATNDIPRSLLAGELNGLAPYFAPDLVKQTRVAKAR